MEATLRRSPPTFHIYTVISYINGAKNQFRPPVDDMKEMAIVLVLTMTGYFVVTNHVPLTPFNNLSPERSQFMSTVVGTLPALLVVLALVEDRGLLIAASWLWIWFLLQVRQWWIPYFFGSTKLHRDLRWYTAGGYNRTLNVLNLKEGRPGPDVQHLVLQLLTILSALAVTARAMGYSL